MRMLKNLARSKRQMIEQSAYYIGYRLFWIIGLFLKGRKFPSGMLDPAQYKLQVFNIVDFVTDEDNLAAMLDFDAEGFFEMMVRLFTSEPWLFIIKPTNYKFKMLRNTTERSTGLATIEAEQKILDE